MLGEVATVIGRAVEPEEQLMMGAGETMFVIAHPLSDGRIETRNRVSTLAWTRTSPRLCH